MKSRKPRTNTRKPEDIPTPAAAAPPEVILAPIIPPKAFSLKQWKTNGVLQKGLREILDNPFFKMAQQTVMMMAMPNAQPVTQLVPGLSAEAMTLVDSQRYHHRSGMAQAFRALENLAQPKDVDTSAAAQWGKLQPEDE